MEGVRFSYGGEAKEEGDGGLKRGKRGKERVEGERERRRNETVGGEVEITGEGGESYVEGE